MRYCIELVSTNGASFLIYCQIFNNVEEQENVLSTKIPEVRVVRKVHIFKLQGAKSLSV